MKKPFQNWLDALESPAEDKQANGSGGPYTRSLICGVVFSTVGMCWKTGFFARLGWEGFLRAWVSLAGYTLLSLLLFTLGMVIHQTLAEGRGGRRNLLFFWLLLAGGISGLILLL